MRMPEWDGAFLRLDALGDTVQPKRFQKMTKKVKQIVAVNGFSAKTNRETELVRKALAWHGLHNCVEPVDAGQHGLAEDRAASLFRKLLALGDILLVYRGHGMASLSNWMANPLVGGCTSKLKIHIKYKYTRKCKNIYTYIYIQHTYNENLQKMQSCSKLLVNSLRVCHMMIPWIGGGGHNIDHRKRDTKKKPRKTAKNRKKMRVACEIL